MSAGDKKKTKVRKNVGKAVAHVKASFNNTIITVVDTAGQVIAWDSAGTIGYKGSRKSTPFAAQRAAEKVADKCKKMGVHEMEVMVRGPGSGRESAVRALASSGFDWSMRDTPSHAPSRSEACPSKETSNA